ncbi:MAG TPA: putative lipid II flippase FtsW [Kiritimatiellia bacterium]|nr:putative lipid II flippase FtsW [Kiritimatiellia bacterium]
MRTSATAIIAIVLILVALGLIMLASTSYVQADASYRDSAYFVKRQLVALVVGLVAFFTCLRIPYHHWKVLAPFIAVSVIILLVMAVTPGVGITVKGSSRWLKLGPVTIQPSELAKFAVIITLSVWLCLVQRTVGTFKNGLLIPGGILAIFAGLIFIEPDFGTTMLIGMVGLSIMFVAGARISYLSIVTVLGLSGFIFAVFKNEVRMRRILAFLNPEKYAQNEAFQLLHAIYAFVLGGFSGAGFGESLQKRFYLPEAHTDFIFAIMGEELGILASLGVVLLFAAFFGFGLFISFRTSDIFGRLVAFGITLMISLQAAINIAVVTGCMPTKGLPLPFISYGGTSLVVTLAMVGVLVNVAFHASEDLVSRHATKNRPIRI